MAFWSRTYSLDCGYLEGTQAADGGGIDVRVGSLPGNRVTAVICTIDLTKRDAEIKILIGCTMDESQTTDHLRYAQSWFAVRDSDPTPIGIGNPRLKSCA